METEYTKTFMMRIEDRFDIVGKGIVITGQVAVGVVRIGEIVWITNPSGAIKLVKIKGIEHFCEQLDFACAGSNVGIVVEGIKKAEISSGDLMYKISLK